MAFFYNLDLQLSCKWPFRNVKIGREMKMIENWKKNYVRKKWGGIFSIFCACVHNSVWAGNFVKRHFSCFLWKKILTFGMSIQEWIRWSFLLSADALMQSCKLEIPGHIWHLQSKNLHFCFTFEKKKVEIFFPEAMQEFEKEENFVWTEKSFRNFWHLLPWRPFYLFTRSEDILRHTKIVSNFVVKSFMCVKPLWVKNASSIFKWSGHKYKFSILKFCETAECFRSCAILELFYEVL